MATINLSENASNVVLDALNDLMSGGYIELASDVDVLAVLRLSDPAALPASAGELEFNQIAEEDAALAQGIAVSGIVFGADGTEVFSCDVGDENSDAAIKLIGTTKIFRGQPVRLASFRLAMP